MFVMYNTDADAVKLCFHVFSHYTFCLVYGSVLMLTPRVFHVLAGKSACGAPTSLLVISRWTTKPKRSAGTPPPFFFFEFIH